MSSADPTRVLFLEPIFEKLMRWNTVSLNPDETYQPTFTAHEAWVIWCAHLEDKDAALMDWVERHPRKNG